MTAKALLERIIKIRKAIDYRRTKIDALIEQAENTSARLTGMPHNPRSDSSPMASAICRKVDLEIEITKLAEERKALIAKIDLLENDDLSRLLILRYVQETPWDDIAAEMGFKKPSVSVAMKNLKASNYITIDENGFINLTETGQEIADKIDARILDTRSFFQYAHWRPKRLRMLQG